MANVTVLDQDARITYTQELIPETCCNCGGHRTVSQLANHMATKHPDYTP
jgi:hypothetical protein